MKKFKSYLLAVAMISLFFVSWSNSSGSSGSSDKEKDKNTPTGQPDPETQKPVKLNFKGTLLSPLPANTDGSAGKTATYMQFGDWPQSAKEDSVTVDENKYAEVGFFKYYKGDDDEWYAKQGNNYFKVEPIKWRVLYTNATYYSNKKLLLCEIPLGECQFYPEDNCLIEIDESTKATPSNYKYSKVRAYLNGLSYIGRNSNSEPFKSLDTYKNAGILQTAFSEQAQKLICTTTVYTDAYNEDYTSTSTMTTEDRLFLLDKSEAEDSSVFATSQLRIRKLTAFQVAATIGTVGEGTSWSLRAITNDDSNKLSYVHKSGVIQVTVPSGVAAVVPALCVEP